MNQKHKKRRSEAQRRHDVLLHQSRYDPVGYRAASLEDMVEAVREQRERASVAERDAEECRNALDSMQSQVCPFIKANKSMWTHGYARTLSFGRS